ncbi:MAG: patatin-like phospholipase family protein [Deltaproteobacteria bacterium]|nr:patatin-like phospholipase family protein [Deltaproteobacteria bacterium]MBW2666139.1 patatin-like phospholipase family protein [Deltaproteobacteria bacterium]
MGLTLIRKSDGTRRKQDPKIALVLAGGAVSGGAFKVGGLKALNDYLGDRKVTDLDLYVGISAGSILGASLASGITPDEMLRVLDGTSTQIDQLRPIDFYKPNLSEFASRPARLIADLVGFVPSLGVDFIRSLPGLPDAAGSAARKFAKSPTYTNFEATMMRVIEHVAPKRSMPAITDHFPTGIFDNVSIERWLRRSLERIRVPNDFQAFERKTGRSLYITACDLDTAERAIFGADEISDITISQAVQASSAVPLFYKPARMNGVDYVDGGVRHTANIDIAIEKGADLIICYNPFRPFLNRVDPVDGEPPVFSEGRYLSDRGMKVIANQVFRTMLHSRLKLGLQRYIADSRFRGDIVLLEPREQDAKFFALNPMAFWKRNEAVQHGFESVRKTLEQNYDELSSVFERYGLELDRDAARRRAERARVAHGWGEEHEKTPGLDDAEGLRLVGS